jgi:hypothetical protein
MAAVKLLWSADLTESPHTGFTSSEARLSVQMFCSLLKYESKFSFEADEDAASDSLADLTCWGRFYETVSAEIYGQNLIWSHLSL